MLQEAEEAEAAEKNEAEVGNSETTAPVKRKAKTKFGGKKKKKKTKTTSSFPGGEEDGYEVSYPLSDVNDVKPNRFCFNLSSCRPTIKITVKFVNKAVK